jgi:hypothetical protein
MDITMMMIFALQPLKTFCLLWPNISILLVLPFPFSSKPIFDVVVKVMSKTKCGATIRFAGDGRSREVFD